MSSRVAFFLLLALAGCATSPQPTAPTRPSASAIPPTYGPRIVPAPRMQCVPFARSLSGVEIYGDANTWMNQARGRYPVLTSPSPRSVMVFRIASGGTRGHVAFVSQVVSSRLILVDHANWHGREEVALDIPVQDVSPANDWSEVKVWWVYSGAWGAKTYKVEGFITGR